MLVVVDVVVLVLAALVTLGGWGGGWGVMISVVVAVVVWVLAVARI